MVGVDRIRIYNNCDSNGPIDRVYFIMAIWEKHIQSVK